MPTGGAAAIVLESERSAIARGARPQAVMRAWGQASDGYHIAQSHPQGAGLRSAMQSALSAAALDTASVSYVNAHATSTPAGDASEARALEHVFTRAGLHPFVSSTKALTGHGLSLSGVMEAAFCVLAIEEGFIPGQAHLQNPDPVCEGLNLPAETLRNARPDVVLNNASGFGGSNVTHVFCPYE